MGDEAKANALEFRFPRLHYGVKIITAFEDMTAISSLWAIVNIRSISTFALVYADARAICQNVALQNWRR
jgi:hypothetical protein